ncbi:hypothetical protein QR98_0075780 [Sarcoptes scabiei]|uniref:Uncharacterized protein n=1 Tax=Sarcoptes scabiei TaxID=52283 RepID=A0A132ADI0_SARSC|nr:hypothetical protein QR98_0075780 [Sarcoptes scabiei]
MCCRRNIKSHHQLLVVVIGKSWILVSSVPFVFRSIVNSLHSVLHVIRIYSKIAKLNGMKSADYESIME